MSVDHYDKRSPDNVRKMLAKRFGLTAAQAAGLVSAGKSLTAELDRIDEDAKKEVRKRYKYVPIQSGKPANPGSAGRPAAPQKTVLERAVEDGLYKQVEGKKAAALAAHFRTLNVDSTAIERISKYIESTILPQIKGFNVDPRASAGSPGPEPPPVPRRLPNTAR